MIVLKVISYLVILVLLTNLVVFLVPRLASAGTDFVGWVLFGGLCVLSLIANAFLWSGLDRLWNAGESWPDEQPKSRFAGAGNVLVVVVTVAAVIVLVVIAVRSFQNILEG